MQSKLIASDASGSRQEIRKMADFFNFYPADNSATVTNIPASEVTGETDEFGCIETLGGLYVPTSPTSPVGIDVDPLQIPDNIFGDQFEIGDLVTSQYYGITGKVVAHAAQFGGRPSIVVEHQVKMLDDPTKSMTDRRTFLAQDFKAL